MTPPHHPAAPAPAGAARFALRLALACTISALVVADARATRERPPPGHTGGFGEPTCQTCHFDQETNAGPGAVSIAGVPDTFEPGRTYTITVRLASPDMAFAGFMLAARFTHDAAQAGTLAPAKDDDDRIELTIQDDVHYAHQSASGSRPASGHATSWTLRWTAPDDPNPIVFHFAANAANGDDSPFGDLIYADSAVSRPTSGPR